MIYAEKSQSVEGRDLITVRFERSTPDAAAPMIEAIFEVRVPSGAFLQGQAPPCLWGLSATRMDTRVAVTLTDEEREDVMVKAAEFAETLTRDD